MAYTVTLLFCSLPILNTHSDAHMVPLGTYLPLAQFGCGGTSLLSALIDMHSGSVCLVSIFSSSSPPACSFHLPVTSFQRRPLLFCDSHFFLFVFMRLSPCLSLSPSLVWSLDLWVTPHLGSFPLITSVSSPSFFCAAVISSRPLFSSHLLPCFLISPPCLPS